MTWLALYCSVGAAVSLLAALILGAAGGPRTFVNAGPIGTVAGLAGLLWPLTVLVFVGAILGVPLAAIAKLGAAWTQPTRHTEGKANA